MKGHSQGEYVFDHSWADAYMRAGGRYYPKIRVAAPFTPATGPRLLVAEGPQAGEARQALIAGLEALREQVRGSSVHVTFAQEPDMAALLEAGFLESATTSSSTGATRASAAMTTSSPRSPRASARH